MKKTRIFSAVALAVLVLAAAVFFYLTYTSNFIPLQIWVVALVSCLLVIMIIAVLVFKTKSGFLTVFGGVLAALLLIGLAGASAYLSRAMETARTVTTTKTEVSSVSIYMLADETDENTALTSELTYGILELQDRENTDEVLRMLSEELEAELNVKSFSGVTVMVDALMNHEVDAVILNSALLNLLDETEGYEKIAEQVREVKNTKVSREVPEEPVVEPTPQFVRKETPSPTSTETVPENRTFTLYLSGIDNRGDLIEKSRSDVNILAVVNPDTHQILLISTPRDSYVSLVLPEGIVGRDKLTHAGIYGVQASMDTLALLYETEIDYYFRVNFSGFTDIIKAMGGVTVYVDHEFSTTEYTFPEGPNELNGYKALSFVRNRFGIGDIQRAKNQMALIKGIIDKATSTDMLLHFNDIMSSVEGCFETSMPYDLISTLVREQLESGAEWNVVSYMPTGKGTSAIPYSMGVEAYVIMLNGYMIETAKDLIQQVYDGEIITAP